MRRILTIIYKTLCLIVKPVRCNVAFMVFMFTLFYVCCQLEIPDIKGYKPYTYAGPEIFADLYVICVILSLFPRKIRHRLRAIFYAVVYPITVIDVFCFVKFGSTISPTMLMLLGETNNSEASEFLASYLSPDILKSAVGTALAIATAHMAWNIIKANRKRLIPGTLKVYADALVSNPTNAIRIFAGAANIFAAAMIIFILADNCEHIWANKKAMHRLFSYSSIGAVEHELTKHDKAQLYAAPQRLAFSIYSNRLAAAQVEKLINGVKNIKVDSCSFRSRNIVLIIGESCNRRHFQLYGYDKPTTPLQVQLRDEGRLIPFSDVVSPWNLTSFVFKHVLSLYAVGDSGEWCDYPLFPELFRKAGYQVAFITNQFLPQAGEALYDFSGGFFLNNPTLSKVQFDIRNTGLHRFDDGVLADYDHLVASTLPKREAEGKGTLTILHLKGQHTRYGERYPLKTRRKFRYTEYSRKLSNRHRYIQADYDNATAYNDSIVHQIVKRFEDRDAIVIYMPDHGEECYLDNRPIMGRNHSARVTYDLAEEEFHIPFWIWCSRQYADTHPDIFNRIKDARNKPFMTDNISQLLLYLAGIECPWTRPDANPLSDTYYEGRPRILKNTVDYNSFFPPKRQFPLLKHESEILR